MDLFASSAKKRHVGQPLAERMRPRSLDELVGQHHLVGPGRILSNLAPGRALPSLILWGPPGSGKTTLARLLGEALKAELTALSAVDAGVKDVREAVAKAIQEPGVSVMVVRTSLAESFLTIQSAMAGVSHEQVGWLA